MLIICTTYYRDIVRLQLSMEYWHQRLILVLYAHVTCRSVSRGKNEFLQNARTGNDVYGIYRSMGD